MGVRGGGVGVAHLHLVGGGGGAKRALVNSWGRHYDYEASKACELDVDGYEFIKDFYDSQHLCQIHSPTDAL